MEDHDFQEMAEDKDPLTMYIVIRRDLNMSVGKTAVQVGHITQMLQIKYYDLHKSLIYRRKSMKEKPMPADDLEAKMMLMESSFEQWMAAGIRKVALHADEKEWFRLKEECKDYTTETVCDAGLTELIPGTETVIGFFPMRKSQRPKILQRLQALK